MANTIKTASVPGRKLGLFAAIALVMGNMIGSGVFLLPTSLAPFGWHAVLGWIISICGTLVLAWVFAALTKANPATGDPSGFCTDAFGPLSVEEVCLKHFCKRMREHIPEARLEQKPASLKFAR